MEVIEWILQDENINEAIKTVKKNKGAYGMDKMSVEELDGQTNQIKNWKQADSVLSDTPMTVTSLSNMKIFLEAYGQWLRHKVRVVILKQWKKPMRIYLNLQKMNRIVGCGFTHEEIFKVANSRLGWYKRSGMYAALIVKMVT